MTRIRSLTSLLLLAAAATAAVVAPVGAQPAASGCSALFPDQEWDLTVDLGPTLLYLSGLPDGIVDRYARELAEASQLIQSEIGGLEDVEICIFDDQLPLDSVALGWPEGQFLRAASFGEERAVVLSAWTIGLVKPAGILGLAHQAEGGSADGAYPEPLGGAVRAWYMSRLTDRLERHHNVMRYANLIQSIPEEIPWTSGSIDELMLWNPEFQESAIGDFTQFVVDRAGLEALIDPDETQLQEIQTEWQRQLLIEARGTDRPTTGWIVGGAIIIALLVLALVIVVVNRKRTRPRKQEPKTLPIEDGGDLTPAGTGGSPASEH
jgi:hypothetical protein